MCSQESISESCPIYLILNPFISTISKTKRYSYLKLIGRVRGRKVRVFQWSLCSNSEANYTWKLSYKGKDKNIRKIQINQLHPLLESRLLRTLHWLRIKISSSKFSWKGNTWPKNRTKKYYCVIKVQIKVYGPLNKCYQVSIRSIMWQIIAT